MDTTTNPTVTKATVNFPVSVVIPGSLAVIPVTGPPEGAVYAPRGMIAFDCRNAAWYGKKTGETFATGWVRFALATDLPT